MTVRYRITYMPFADRQLWYLMIGFKDSALITPMILRKSIRTRLLITLLGLITITVILFSLLGVINIFTAGRNAERVGNVTLREQAEEYLVNLTQVTAEKHDLSFQRARNDVEYIADYASSIFSHPERYNPASYWKAEENMNLNQFGTYLSNSDDLAGSLVVPQPDGESDGTLEKLALFDVLFIPVHKSHPNALIVSVIAKEGVVRT
jgi:hypothetical protein